MDTRPTALELFRMGFDTVEIAVAIGATEAAASRMIHEQRCAERGLPVEYQRHVRRVA